MHSQKPDFVTINSRKVKVQQWQHLPDRVLLTTLVHGDSAGTDLLADLRGDTGTLQWADSPTLTIRPEVINHRAAGSGPATVHRIEVILWLTSRPPNAVDESIEAKLDRVLMELHALRAEVAELRGARRPGAGGTIAAPLASGRTMLDFEIDENG